MIQFPLSAQSHVAKPEKMRNILIQKHNIYSDLKGSPLKPGEYTEEVK